MERVDSRLLAVARLAHFAWRHLRQPDDPSRRAELESFLLERIVRRPLLYEDARGLRYILRPGENAGVYLAHQGNYEVAETRFCERFLQRGEVAFDVGANIGLYTLLFSLLVGPEGEVHAFEPEPDNFARLRLHLRLNGAANVHATRAAVFSDVGPVALNVFTTGLNAWHSLGRPRLPDPFRRGAIAEPAGAIDVEATSLDSYCSEHGINRIDFLKIDVEGAELDVLRGGRGLLADGRVGLILFEVSLPQVEGMGHEPGEIFAELAALGYRSYRLDDDGGPAGEATVADARYENYVASRDAFTGSV